MKGVSKPEMDRTVIIVKDGPNFELRVWNRLLGDAPIGARLAKKGDLPALARKTESFNTAMDLQARWQRWLDDQPITGRGRKR